MWGDDTDMVEYWSDYALACDDGGKITRALRRFWEGVYRDCLVDGVSRTIRDNLHSYEEGMGTICHQLLVDYGNPIAVEHVCRAASHYYPKWMKKNDDGTYSFRSYYLGYGGVYTEGKFAQDKGVNYLMLFPAAYLTWYNRHPEATKYVRYWKRAPDEGGLVLAVDRKLDSIYDMDDATKVLTDQGRIVEIHKELQEYDSVDTGLFMCTEALFDEIEKAKRANPKGDCSLSEGVKALAALGLARVHDVGNGLWQDVDTPGSVSHAKKLFGS